MNKIERQETIIRNVVKWVAKDGQEFDTEVACRDYESSAECAIKSLYNSFIIGTTDEWKLLRGDSDHQVDILRVPDDMAVMTILKMLALIQNREPDAVSVDIIKNSIGEILFVGWSYDKDWCWVIGTQKSIADNITKVIEENVKKANS